MRTWASGMAALIMPSISAGFIGMLLSLSLKSSRQSCRVQILPGPLVAALVVACSAAHVARQPALVAGPEVCQGYGLSRRQDQAGVCALGACPPDRPGRHAGPFRRGQQAARVARRDKIERLVSTAKPLPTRGVPRPTRTRRETDKE